MTDRVEFHNSKPKLLGLFFATILMVGASYFCTRLPGAVPQAFGWFGVCFFGIGFVVIPARFFKSGPQVVIDGRGIEDRRTTMGLIVWEDVTELRVGKIQSTKMLSIEVREPEKYLSKLKPAYRLLAKGNPSVGFSEITIAFTGLSPSIDKAWPHVERIAAARREA